MIPIKEPFKIAQNFVADAFSTIECHDLRVEYLDIGVDFYDALKEKDLIDEFEGNEILWGAIIRIIRNGCLIARSSKEFGYKNCFYHFIKQPYHNLDTYDFHDMENPQCEICKAQIQGN